MAKLTRAEFSRLIGKDRAYVTMNVKRGKIIVDVGDVIDTQNEVNQLFLQKTEAITELKEEVKQSKYYSEVQDELKETRNAIKSDKEDLSNKSLTDLERDRKELEILIKREELELKKIEVEKKNGLLVPTDQVKGVVSRLGKNYVHTFKNEGDKLITKILHELNADNDYRAKIKGLFVKLINDSITETLDITEKELDAVVEENKFIK